MNSDIQQIIDDIHSYKAKQCLPVDLNIIIEEERNIRPRPSNYGENFDGRIEYIPAKKIFILYHPKINAHFPNPRVRFSIAHELGHYFIPAHRQLLLSRKSHNSTTGFISDKRLESEADEFAASLLIPQYYIDDLIQKRRFLTLKDLLAFANELQVSATAMAVRYTKTTTDRCAIIISKDEHEVFYLPSEEMDFIGFKWRGRKDIPCDSASFQASQNQGCNQIFEKATDSSTWFSERKKECDIWEEAFPLGYTGLVLTMLADRSFC